jgi:hypothetical protein
MDHNRGGFKNGSGQERPFVFVPSVEFRTHGTIATIRSFSLLERTSYPHRYFTIETMASRYSFTAYNSLELILSSIAYRRLHNE